MSESNHSAAGESPRREHGDEAPIPSLGTVGGDNDHYARRVLTAVLIALAVIVLALFVWYALYVLLLAFAGILVGVLLHSLAKGVSRFTRMGHGWALTLVITLLIAGLGLTFWLLAPSVARQVDQFSDRLPQTVGTVQGWLGKYGWGRQLLSRGLGGGDNGGGNDRPINAGVTPGAAADAGGPPPGAPPPPAADAPPPPPQPASTQPSATQSAMGSAPASPAAAVKQVVAAATGRGGSVFDTMRQLVFSAFSAVVAIMVVLVVGIYMAAVPDLYLRGVLHLIPVAQRPRVRHTLYTVGHALRWWLIGQGVTMTVIGAITAVGLKLIGVQLWLAFGVLAALFNFIPNFGPLISFTPAFLFALADSPTKAAWVAGLYIVAQSLEGYVLTPMVQKKAVDMPPALLILFQVLMGFLGGPIGVVLAAPLIAATLVIVQMLYVHDTLGDPIHPDGESNASGKMPAKAQAS